MARRTSKSRSKGEEQHAAETPAVPPPRPTLQDEFDATLGDQCQRIRRSGVIDPTGTSMKVLEMTMGYLLKRAEIESRNATAGDGAGLMLPPGMTWQEFFNPPQASE